MLASSSFHLPGNFWAALAVVAAVLVPVIIWRFGTPRRLLLYSLVSDTALLSSDARARAAGAELQIILGGQELTDPHFVALRIESRSRADVRPEDFTDGRPLMFELAVPILKVLGSDTGGEKMPEVTSASDGSRVTVSPALINRRQVITLDLLTDGPVTLTCPNPSLADVTVRERMDDTVEPPWQKRTAAIAIVTALAGAVLIGIAHARHIVLLGDFAWGITDAALLALAGSGVLALALVTVRNGGLPRRARTREARD